MQTVMVFAERPAEIARCYAAALGFVRAALPWAAGSLSSHAWPNLVVAAP